LPKTADRRFSTFNMLDKSPIFDSNSRNRFQISLELIKIKLTCVYIIVNLNSLENNNYYTDFSGSRLVFDRTLSNNTLVLLSSIKFFKKMVQ